MLSWGVKNCRFYLVKRQLRWGEGVKNRRFWDNIVYGRPLTAQLIHSFILFFLFLADCTTSSLFLTSENLKGCNSLLLSPLENLKNKTLIRKLLKWRNAHLPTEHCVLWQYGWLSFQGRDTKLDIFFAKFSNFLNFPNILHDSKLC